MRYTNGIEIRIGDHVVVEKNVEGIVVCDYEKQCCLPGYDSWLTDLELVGGGTLASGVMIKTVQLGFLHYPEEDEDIVLKVRP